MGNMLRQVIWPLHQEQRHKDPFLKVTSHSPHVCLHLQWPEQLSSNLQFKMREKASYQRAAMQHELCLVRMLGQPVNMS